MAENLFSYIPLIFQDTESEGKVRIAMAEISENQDKDTQVKQLYEREINIMIQNGDKKGEADACDKLGILCYNLSNYAKAKECVKRALAIRIEIGDRQGEATDYGNLGTVFKSLGEYVKAKEYLEKALAISIEIGDRQGEATTYGNLGTVFMSLGKYVKAKECIQKALPIKIEIGHKGGEASCYGNLGTVFMSLGEYVKAKEHLDKALAIRIEIGDRQGEAADYGNLANVFRSLSEYVKAEEYLKKALSITIEIGDREGEASCYGNLGTVFMSLGEYVKAKEFLEKALALSIEIGDRQGEATGYANLGTMFRSLGEYVKAEEYLEKALATKIEIGDRDGEASCYGNLGIVFKSLGEYVKAKEYLEKALAIRIEIGDRQREATDYGNLGTVFMSLGEYVKAKEFLEKGLAISIEIGDREGEAADYGNLGTVFKSLGEYVKAKQYLEKALAIKIEIGNREGEASCYGNLGTVFMSLGKYVKAKEYLEKALAIRIEIGDRKGEATAYGNLGTVFKVLGENVKAEEYLKKALAIKIEIGDREGEALCYRNLGIVFSSLGEHVKASDYEVAGKYLDKALFISRDVGNRRAEFEILLAYALWNFHQNKFEDALSYLYQCIEKFEELRNFLGVNDEFKISFFDDSGAFPYKLLSTLLSVTGNPRDALYVEELGRARGLSDLMAAKYSIETHISTNPLSWFGIENITRKENNCAILYISYFENDVHLWVLKTSGAIHFKRKSVKENFAQGGRITTFLATQSFRSFTFLPEEDCEDRSLNIEKPRLISPEQESSADLRLLEEDDEETMEERLKKLNLSLLVCYKIFIAPVADLLNEPEVILVPHSSLYKVPFAALRTNEGKYLSETQRIRIVPSLTTLKLIQDSPAAYHSQTGSLIVGDPKVGWVMYKGNLVKWLPLDCARKEAKMVGRLVSVKPLLGEQATKQAVLEEITSASLIHFAAHGDAERGEIALSPIRTPDSSDIVPQEEDYLLTMADISRVKVRAKLVVLSCCHSGSGQVKAEGVIGIARAFLGSGARSVLVALWAIEDTATEQLMSRFYEHLVCGESSSESLHQAMKWMRNNGFIKVSQWAPFMLIGDNVTFEFHKEG